MVRFTVSSANVDGQLVTRAVPCWVGLSSRTLYVELDDSCFEDSASPLSLEGYFTSEDVATVFVDTDAGSTLFFLNV